jgi:hypothetical protein
MILYINLIDVNTPAIKSSFEAFRIERKKIIAKTGTKRRE